MLTLLSKLPLSVLYKLSALIYVLLVYVVRYRVDVVDANLQGCFPNKSAGELKQIRKQFYRQAADVLVEVIAAYRLDAAAFVDRVRFENPELIEELISNDKPFILLAAHQCNWEWLLLGLGVKFSVPIDAVYKPLSQQSVDRFMQAVRTRFGADPVPKNNALIEMMRRRGAMRVFAMVADQAPVLVRETCWLKFMGRDTPFQVGVQKIASATRYPVLFVAMRRTSRGRYSVRFHSVGSPPYKKDGYDLVYRYAELVQKQIDESPCDWLWTNRRWKHKKPIYD